MRKIIIGQNEITVKDYHCSLWGEEQYILQDEPKLWLYVNMTNACQASCPFCVNPSWGMPSNNPFDIEQYKKTLQGVLHRIRGISFTGGEPLLDLDLMRKVLKSTAELVDENIELDLVTNGIHLEDFCNCQEALYLTSIHISRHSVDDSINAQIQHWNAPSKEQLKRIVSKYKDPYAFVFNCVLQKCAVNDAGAVAEYLEMAGEIGIKNTSFIGMMNCSDYWNSQYISPVSLHLEKDPRFRIWNHYHDKEYCSCSTGDYESRHGYTKFYYRWPGKPCPNYCRQLVYTADNKLLAGFGGEKIVL